jgi:MFS transporter, DHA2 family, multidrug resistance protein
MLARRAQVHQVRLSEHLSAANPQFRAMVQGMSNTFGASGSTSPMQSAYAMIQANVIRQSTMLAYIDIFWLLGVVIFCLIPFVLLIKKAKPGGGMAVH